GFASKRTLRLVECTGFRHRGTMKRHAGNKLHGARPVWAEVARRLADRLHDLARKPAHALLLPESGDEFLSEFEKQFQKVEHSYLSAALEEGARFDALLGLVPPGIDPVDAVAAALPYLMPDSPLLLAALGEGSGA